MKSVVVIAHNLRSTHNIGSLFRTAEGLGIHKIWLTGYSPYPLSSSDERLPHIAQKIHKQITKTALGAESMVPWEHCADVHVIIDQLKDDGYTIAALEQTKDSVMLHDYKAHEKVALILGREVEGIEPEVLQLCDESIEIPMVGLKESYNVVQAAAMALYTIQYSQH